jgi:ABC-type Fe3+ transport system substrate-binding protein
VKRFLTEMEPLVSRDIRQMVDWLAQGKVALAALQNADRLDIWQAKQQGLPVDSFITGGFREGGFVGSGGGNVMLVNRAPHPNAAKIFINWLLSRDGQIVFQRLEAGKNSLRIDIPKDDLPERSRILPGARYALLEDPAYADLGAVRRFVAEVWKKRSEK